MTPESVVQSQTGGGPSVESAHAVPLPPAPPATGSICVVGSSTLFFSGISRYTIELTNAFAARYDTSAVLMRRLLPRRLYPGRKRVGTDLADVRIRRDVPVFDGVDYYWLPSIARCLRFLLRERPAVVVLQWWTATVAHSYLVLVLFARLTRAKVVIEFHELLDSGEAAKLVPRVYARLAMRRLAAAADAFVVHSDYDRRAVAAHYALSRGKPVAVVPHGPYALAGTAAGRTVRSGDGPLEVLFFGTIRPYKGLEHLINAFDSLSAEEAAGFRLTVIGETWEGWTLPGQLIAASRHRQRITFVNTYVTDAEAATAFARSDAVVLPYLRSSASGPLHMAMSCGLPVIVSAVGGLVEAAGDYEGARFTAPGDITDLRAALLELPARAVRRHADPHSWSRSVSRYEALFGEIHARLRPRSAP